MKLEKLKNGKGYRCDSCRKLLYERDVMTVYWQPLDKDFYFCNPTHAKKWVHKTHQLRLGFDGHLRGGNASQPVV